MRSGPQITPDGTIAVLQRLDNILLVLGTGVLAFLFIRWLLTRRSDPLANAPVRPNWLTPDLAMLPVIVWMLGLYLSQAFLRLSVQSRPDAVPEEIQNQIGAAIAQILGAACCILLARKTFADGLAGYGLKPHRPISATALGIATILAIWPIMYGLHEAATWLIIVFHPEFQPPPHQLLQTLDRPGTPGWAGPFLWSTAVLVAPVAEEMFFRGIIQTSLRHFFTVPSPTAPNQAQNAVKLDENAPRYAQNNAIVASNPPPVDARGRWLPILVTGCAFGLIHFPQPQAVPALIVLGIALGYAYERTGNLAAPIVMHILFNLKTMVFHSIASS